MYAIFCMSSMAAVPLWVGGHRIIRSMAEEAEYAVTTTEIMKAGIIVHLR